VIKDNDGVDIGAVGTVDLLQNVNLSTQPVSALDWSPDKVKFFSLPADPAHTGPLICCGRVCLILAAIKLYVGGKI
jgi:hypothetical protein